MHTTISLNTEKILVASDDTPLTITRACSPSRNRIHIKHIKDTIYNLMIFTRSKISLRFFILAAAAPLLCFFLFSQSFAFLFVPSWTPMRALTLFVAILHRAAAHASLEFAGAGLWFAARRTTNGKRRCCCCGCRCCWWFAFLFIQYFKIVNSVLVSFVCCFGPPFTC